ncbi:hypothetical protein [Xanthocytophaga agilis]|uniref:Uncharacterized protein n=1 Tax=Xanthocytophaga agilis TaxID=3048010 RepID=A0AAE3RCD8_9BACT|nr:hypothetical protein [Xanthocytophaga agilis]MDJ1505857.1 hypothetical protein [Xanthocytophaga agilis]
MSKSKKQLIKPSKEPSLKKQLTTQLAVTIFEFLENSLNKAADKKKGIVKPEKLKKLTRKASKKAIKQLRKAQESQKKVLGKTNAAKIKQGADTAVPTVKETTKTPSTKISAKTTQKAVTKPLTDKVVSEPAQ